MEKMLALGIILSAKDMLSPTMGKAIQKVDQYEAKTKKLGSSITKLGTVSLGAGLAIGAALREPYEAFNDLKAAQGEIASLDIGDMGIKEITKEARAFSNQFSGTTAPEFVRASYDIKSGISSLSDVGVAKFTRLAALTGKATKSTTDQMTSFFATGYGIYMKQFDEMQRRTVAGWDALSQEEKDIRFGETFAAGVGAAVKMFKTDGTKMQNSIEALGATATTSNVPLAEQLAILGSMQKTFASGQEAATAYKGFLLGAAKAQEKLNMKFVDANNQLLSAPEILDKLRAKYGNVLDDMEKMEIKEAFGTDEGMKFINGFYNETDKLKESIDGMESSLQGGTAEVERMAKAMNAGKEMELLQQRIGNLTTVIGGGFAPAVNFVGDVIGKVTIKMAAWMEKHPELTKWVTGGIALFGAAAVVLGTVGIAVGAVTMALPFMTKNLVLVGGALKFVAATSLTLAKVLLLNPIGATVAGIAAGAYLIYSNWDKLKAWFSGLWDNINDMFRNSAKFIGAAILSPIDTVKSGWESLLNWFSAKFEWLSNTFNTVTGWIGKTMEWVGLGDGSQEPAAIAVQPNGNQVTVGKVPTAPKPKLNYTPLTEKSAYTPKASGTGKSKGDTVIGNVNVTVNNPAKNVDVEKAVQQALRKCNGRSLSDDV